MLSTQGKEKAALVLIKPGPRRWGLENAIAELKLLTETLGVKVCFVSTLRQSKPHPATFIGQGQAEEMERAISEAGCNLVIFDSELKPVQQRNLERIINARIIDRTQLILDIFSQRARSQEGKLQVELAQLKHLLSRLTGKGVGLSQVSGILGGRGHGEPQLEIDRRAIRRRLRKIEEQIEKVKKHRTLLRKGRKSHSFQVALLVGYTNSGKSTLLNTLGHSDITVEDRLFSTLDPTTRKVFFSSNREILMTDTVGFIRQLPHDLIAAFKATLEEVVEADILINVLDASHPMREEQNKVVLNVLNEIGAGETTVITALNKIDLIPDAVERRQIQNEFPDGIPISALKKTGLDELMNKVEAAIECIPK
ncbi:GTPase HflX [candidate division NPL-UPA2 bacterium Unc8]|uniref:GTPase HflX n=1 Tax=candidate division NPL-UPA2 bacterium Unc8 TaxID=1980939 RepID=A0A399FV22_UNCN2|nr:GTPase HflX [Bacillota bacterium]MBT9147062.1 GTPase HflX [Bacillota bacterium]RIH99920.1 MAG: GTPase HflX [candidate division NPL-UPA2 bacterium Unc8]